MGAIELYFASQPDTERRSKLTAISAKEAFEAMMEGAAMMLDFIGAPLEYTYITKSGNKVHVLMDSP